MAFLLWGQELILTMQMKNITEQNELRKLLTLQLPPQWSQSELCGFPLFFVSTCTARTLYSSVFSEDTGVQHCLAERKLKPNQIINKHLKKPQKNHNQTILNQKTPTKPKIMKHIKTPGPSESTGIDP